MGKKKSIQETIIIVPDDIQCEKRSSKPQSFLQDNKLEIIAVNDGSTDGSEEICKQFMDDYPDSFVLLNKTKIVKKHHR